MAKHVPATGDKTSRLIVRTSAFVGGWFFIRQFRLNAVKQMQWLTTIITTE